MKITRVIGALPHVILVIFGFLPVIFFFEFRLCNLKFFGFGPS